MPKQSAFEWIVEKLEGNDKVESITVDSENLLTVIRTDGSKLTVTKTSLDSFNVSNIRSIIDVQIANFILHTSKEPFVSGSVFSFLEERQIVLGGFGDLIRVVNQGKNWPYLSPEVRFIVRGLEQHTKVSAVYRLDNKRYQIDRHELETVIIIALNDYDLSIESIRSAVDEFGQFDAILKSNPNGRITSLAVEFADSREIKVFKWGELLGKINSRWTWKK
ncbi:hypothetical protein VF13_37010 [Nostoc linckia z16]|nr:hypothetical protein VF13_37010 [Nostoc linckia z16]